MASFVKGIKNIHNMEVFSNLHFLRFRDLITSNQPDKSSIFSNLAFYPHNPKQAQRAGYGDMHPLFIQIRHQPKIRDNHRRTFQPLEAKEGVANDVFFGFGICGKDERRQLFS